MTAKISTRKTAEGHTLETNYADSVGLAIATACLQSVCASERLPVTASEWHRAFVATRKVKDCEAAYAHALAAGLLMPRGVDLVEVNPLCRSFFEPTEWEPSRTES